MKRDSTLKQFVYDAHYWVEVEHKDMCAYCKDQNLSGQQQCAAAAYNATRARTRVAMFVYFMEALDYAEKCSKGIKLWVRKPRYTSDGIESEYSVYLDGKLITMDESTEKTSRALIETA